MNDTPPAWLPALQVFVGLLVILSATAALASLSLLVEADDFKQELRACVQETGGLRQGAPVKLAGVVIGKVASVSYDPESRCARIEMKIARGLALPSDSQLSVSSTGMLGGRHVSIEPGGAASVLREGGSIEQAHSALVLETIVRRRQ